MKYNIFLTFFSFYLLLHAQKIGINEPKPQALLDIKAVDKEQEVLRLSSPGVTDNVDMFFVMEKDKEGAYLLRGLGVDKIADELYKRIALLKRVVVLTKDPDSIHMEGDKKTSIPLNFIISNTHKFDGKNNFKITGNEISVSKAGYYRLYGYVGFKASGHDSKDLIGKRDILVSLIKTSSSDQGTPTQKVLVNTTISKKTDSSISYDILGRSFDVVYELDKGDKISLNAQNIIPQSPSAKASEGPKLQLARANLTIINVSEEDNKPK